ncbi:T9SS-dependent choice-of-anchor J family protein [Lacinutrix himadriensis]|uniref:T9SS-dependent choice-of-anchor J family protein n=1 Tax=Lacinutrix himadriensis TaxID=641549 RepID=UPI0009F86119|nr:T9SS type A sorting domain-containing protein [Lacinutrix himadriensis]
MKKNYFKKGCFYFMFLAVLGLQAQSKSVQNQRVNTNERLQLNDENQRFFDEHGVVRCATVEAHELRMQNNPAVQSMDEFENWMAPLVEAKKARMIQDAISGSANRVVYNIPIIFHVITGSAGDAYDLDAVYINAQIDQLNIDFNNMAGSTHPAAYSADINFIPAQVDPSGNPLAEPGIHRVYGYSGAQSSGTMDGGVKQATIWDRSKYANIWTANLSGGLLGYAQFPSNSTLPGLDTDGGSVLTDGVVCLYSTIGSVATPYPGGAPYNLGRTLTHEVGHWIGLRHIWGDTSSCANTDYCADTPDASGSNGGCPTVDSCPSDGLGNDMVENFMDYTNDACMDIFTFDQVARIMTVIENADDFDLLVSSTTGNSSPVIAFATPDVTELEGTSCTTRDIDIAVNIGLEASANATVTFSASGSATNMVDFEILTPTVTFAAGSLDSKTLTIRVYEDGFNEGDEDIVVTMTLNANGGDGELATNGNEILTLTLTDDDIVPGGSFLETVFSDGFETYADFEIGTIGDWTMLDGDGDPTYPSDNFDFPNEEYTGTFIVYNASATTPSSVGSGWDPHSGDKAYYCFNEAVNPFENDDYIFTPLISLNGTGSELKYWSKGLTDNYNGGERYQVGVSTTDTNPTSFTYLTADPYAQPSLEWEEYTLDLSAYDGQDVYLTFHVVSSDEFVFMLDDVSVTTNATTAVQTDVNTASSAQMNINGMGTVYAYDSASDNIIAKIDNNDAFDYGCTDISVMRAGTGAQILESATSSNFVADKAYKVTTENANVSGDVTNTFYLTEDEILGWETATGRDRSDLVIFREVDGEFIESIASIIGSYGSDITLEGTFTGANGNYYFGPSEALSIADNSFETFALYPNPSNGEINVNLSTSQDVNVTLYDVRGRKVFANSYNNSNATFNKTINLETVSAGLYLIQFESGSKKTTKKLVIK